MIDIGDGRVEPRNTGGVLPSYCVESPAISSVCPSTLSPAATVCKDDDVMSDKSAPEFKLSQCFGDCSPAEEATQGEQRRCVRERERDRKRDRETVCCGQMNSGLQSTSFGVCRGISRGHTG